MAHQHVDAVKKLAASAADLAARLDGPRFEPTGSDYKLMDLARLLAGEKVAVKPLFPKPTRQTFEAHLRHGKEIVLVLGKVVAWSLPEVLVEGVSVYLDDASFDEFVAAMEGFLGGR